MKRIDKIKALSVWDMAEWIYEVSNNSTEITNCKEVCADCEYSDSFCVSGIAEWLNEQTD